LTKNQFLVNFYQVIPPKEFLTKNPHKKSSQKKSSQKISPKKFLQINSSRKILPKKFQKNFQTISQKISKILKVSNSLHTLRPKTLLGLFILKLKNLVLFEIEAY
jgi:hypothetical protein